ncbi:unnamed protein product [Effrenium voratum]|uniref:Uncharacterized protein n=1 Tax=Effrenium voratum TaxID=2562239 RepID=A0AA36N1P2_9DINO|nr:unnamed protein product [Effrenium voratum]CAJ1426311.1 unnamed protein product [Effrenium voratum]
MALVAMLRAALVLQVGIHAWKCSSVEQCHVLLAKVTAVRQEKEARALELSGLAQAASQKAAEAEEISRSSLQKAEKAEAEKARWKSRKDALEAQLRSLQEQLKNASAKEKQAEEAEQKVDAAKVAALKDKEREAEISAAPAQERCLDDFASCTAGLMVVQIQQWMSLLHINRFLVSVSSVLLGAVLLLLPAEAQGSAFAVASLVILPLLVGGSFRDFLSLVGQRPPEILTFAAGLLTATLALAFLWKGADGLRLLLGAGLTVLLGDLIQAVLCLALPATLEALSALALGLLGAAAGLYQKQSIQAFAMAAPAALLVSSGVLLFLATLSRSEAYLEDITSVLLPWAEPQSKEAAPFIWCGRLLWLLLQLPALARLRPVPAPVAPVAPSEQPAPAAKSGEPAAAAQANAAPSAAAAAEPSAAATAEAIAKDNASNEVPDLDPVATTELLQRTVNALQALERALPPRASSGPPPTSLAASSLPRSGEA